MLIAPNISDISKECGVHMIVSLGHQLAHRSLRKPAGKVQKANTFASLAYLSKNNLYRHVKNMELISKEYAVKQKRVMPSSSSIKQHITIIAMESFSRHAKHNEALKVMKENGDVLEGMLVLAQRKQADVNVKHASHTYRIYQCQDTTCKEILISSKRSDNAAYCGVCKSKNGSIKRAPERRKRRSVNKLPWSIQRSHETHA